MNNDDLLDGVGDLLMGALFFYVLWFVMAGLLYVAAFICVVIYTAITTLIVPLLTSVSGSVWRFLSFQFARYLAQKRKSGI
jgi:hypothetical protein